LAGGAQLDSLLPEAFAAVRESAKRSKEMRHYDVQMIGGIVLHQGAASARCTHLATMCQCLTSPPRARVPPVRAHYRRRPALWHLRRCQSWCRCCSPPACSRTAVAPRGPRKGAHEVKLVKPRSSVSPPTDHRDGGAKSAGRDARTPRRAALGGGAASEGSSGGPGSGGQGEPAWFRAAFRRWRT
jgi:hypothetical protein